MSDTTETTLEEFIEEVAGQSHLRVEADLGDGFVRLKSDEAQRRQAIQDIRCVEDALVELLRNSRDAHATVIYVAVSKEETNREITVIDNGCGVPRSMRDMVFEPRVTSKLDTASIDKWGVHGRGMALYSIKYNAQEAYVVDSVMSGGTSIRCIFDTTKLKEKSDQSSFPQFKKGEQSTVGVSGPRNILRNACEFALEHRDSVSVYIGSPSEIAATLYDFGIKHIPFSSRCAEVNFDRINLRDRLAYCAEPTEFCSVAESIGLNLSGRTATRIMNGEITPLVPLIDLVKALLLQPTDFSSKKTFDVKDVAVHGKHARKKSIAIAHEDLESFKEQVAQAYRQLADRYYLQRNSEVTVKNANGTLSISIELKDADEEDFSD